MAAARYSSEVLQVFYGPIAEQENAGLPQPLAESIISEAIRNLLPKLQEMILKEFISIKMKQREELGWKDVHFELLKAPFCEERARIVKVMWCRKCNQCGRNGLSLVCSKNGIFHYLSYPFIGDYEDNFYHVC